MGVLKSECALILVLFLLLFIPGFIDFVIGEPDSNSTANTTDNVNTNPATNSVDNANPSTSTTINPAPSCNEKIPPSCFCGTCGNCQTQHDEEDKNSCSKCHKEDNKNNEDKHYYYNNENNYNENHKEKVVLSTYYFTKVCEPNWACSQWSGECVNGFITRKCIDKNGCNENIGKPNEYIQCEEQTVMSTDVQRVSRNVDVANKNLVTASNTDYLSLWVVIGLIVLVFILILVALLRR